MSLDITLTVTKPTEVHWQNITHNLGSMAEEAGIYEVLWHPERSGIKTAGQLIEPLRTAIAEMQRAPDHFKQFDSPNGWGIYDDFLPCLLKLLAACADNPDAEISVSI